MIRTATADVFPAIRELLSRANDAPYDLGRVAEEKCFGAGYAGEPVVRMFENLGLAVTCGRHLRLLAVDREARGRGIGTALLQDSSATIAAAEPGNYFLPGVLPDVAAFLHRRGWRETAETHNLEAPLIRLRHLLPTSWGEGGSNDEALLPSARGEGARSADEGSPDRDRVLAFVERHFGPIWRFESSRATSLFHVEHDGEIAGFAAIEANNRGLGTFGPTGVAESLRGRGYGRTLLLAALAGLRRLGYSRAVIPWTDAIDFYRRSCGAEPTHRFVIMRRQ